MAGQNGYRGRVEPVAAGLPDIPNPVPEWRERAPWKVRGKSSGDRATAGAVARQWCCSLNRVEDGSEVLFDTPVEVVLDETDCQDVRDDACWDENEELDER